jgi:tRNA1Val (adenine37-N6)-methyltransferase
LPLTAKAMPAQEFHFKQFVIRQDKCAMKTGTDSMLLGAWAQPPAGGKILDIGTGTGILALMLAQKTEAKIDAIEPEENAFLQATENIKNSSWQKRIHVIHCGLQDFQNHHSESYDFIISNPPFFEAPNTEKGRNKQNTYSAERANARFADFLSHTELINGVKKLLKPAGKFMLILPAQEGEKFREKALETGFFLQKLLKIKSKPMQPVKRLIMEFGFEKLPILEEDFTIYEADGSYTNEYKKLTMNYHAKTL